MYFTSTCTSSVKFPSTLRFPACTSPLSTVFIQERPRPEICKVPGQHRRSGQDTETTQALSGKADKELHVYTILSLQLSRSQLFRWIQRKNTLTGNLLSPIFHLLCSLLMPSPSELNYQVSMTTWLRHHRSYAKQDSLCPSWHIDGPVICAPISENGDGRSSTGCTRCGKVEVPGPRVQRARPAQC